MTTISTADFQASHVCVWFEPGTSDIGMRFPEPPTGDVLRNLLDAGFRRVGTGGRRWTRPSTSARGGVRHRDALLQSVTQSGAIMIYHRALAEDEAGLMESYARQYGVPRVAAKMGSGYTVFERGMA